MLTLYGIRKSRAFRCLWMLEEAGAEYNLERIDFSTGATQHPEFTQLNPNGKIPVLKDGDLILFESLAINLHLAKHYVPHLWRQETKQQLSSTNGWHGHWVNLKAPMTRQTPTLNARR